MGLVYDKVGFLFFFIISALLQHHLPKGHASVQIIHVYGSLGIILNMVPKRGS